MLIQKSSAKTKKMSGSFILSCHND